MTTTTRLDSGPVSFSADDDQPLQGTWFAPPDRRVRGFVVIAPAMATPARFYTAFATWLADNGFATLTFDFRGVDSPRLRRESADLLRWAADAASALEHAVAERERHGLPDVPITWIGHSFGGQVLGLVRNELIAHAILVATGNGYYRHNPPALRRKAPFLWRVLVPVSTALVGYFPGRRLRILGDLPAGVARQWGRWCLHPDYWGADVPDIERRHAAIRHPVTALAFTDDEIITASGLRALTDQLSSAPAEVMWLSPADIGVGPVGHHGFFRRQMASAWQEVLLPRLAAADR